TLGETAATSADFDRVVARAQATLADATLKQSAKDDRDAKLVADMNAKRAHRELVAERDDLASRRGNIPAVLHRARLALAEAAGLNEKDVPFVGELIEVRTEHEAWREAFNLALGGFATTVLLDTAHLARFRQAIDSVPSDVRVRFEGVPVDLSSTSALDPGTLPGRLEFAASPFDGWLRERLAEQFAFVCVDQASHLSQYAKALTRTGQMSAGARGAHGGHGRANVLGFTNTRHLADLDRRIEAARDRLRQASEAFRGAELGLTAVEEQTAAARIVTGLTWGDVDVMAARADVARWDDVISQAREASPQLDELRDHADALDTQIDALNGDLGVTRQQAIDLHACWERVSDDVDAAQGIIDAADDRGDLLTAAQQDYLDAVLNDDPAAVTPDQQPASPDGSDSSDGNGSSDGDPAAASVAGPATETLSPDERLAVFDAAMSRASGRLRHDRESAHLAVDSGMGSLQTIFTGFVARWPDPNLGTDPDASYRDFERILDALESERLHQLEAQWRRSLLRMSGADLTELEATISRSLREITERIDPINQILATLPFADDGHRLRIDASRVQSTVVARFRKDLRDLRALLQTDASDEEREQRYARMARLVDRIRPGSPDRADLIDVRRHVRLSAEKVDLDGNHVALYDHIGEKSGGESQELVAFIVGAALRYQLGDAGADRPRYAPVFLDEALIKADAQFSGRAIGAWRGLGFQLVVGAPNDKVSALEPHVDASYVVVKDAAGRSRAKAVVGVPDDLTTAA
ncbi:MAG: hypothetical protein LBB54_06155, partial [Cellulomonadaceae bacterium]|nr:hypothetical protein [Cellulomonadaceae bacterium]